MNGSIPFLVYDAQNAEGFLARVLKLVRLVAGDSDEVVGHQVDRLISEPNATLAAENHDAMFVLVPLERRVTAGRHLVIANLERRLHIVAQDLLRDGHPPAWIVLIGLDFDSIPLATTISGDHVGIVPARL